MIPTASRGETSFVKLGQLFIFRRRLTVPRLMADPDQGDQLSIFGRLGQKKTNPSAILYAVPVKNCLSLNLKGSKANAVPTAGDVKLPMKDKALLFDLWWRPWILGTRLAGV